MIHTSKTNVYKHDDEVHFEIEMFVTKKGEKVVTRILH